MKKLEEIKAAAQQLRDSPHSTDQAILGGLLVDLAETVEQQGQELTQLREALGVPGANYPAEPATAEG